jgi:non-ribosomal peptide synthetase component F
MSASIITILGQFEQKALSTPDSVAVVCADENVTYRELSAQATRVAHALADAGVRSETLVGVFLDRRST